MSHNSGSTIKTSLNREVSRINRLFLRQSPESTPPESVHWITSPLGTPPSARKAPILVPTLTEDTDIENYDEHIELERLEGNTNATKRMREGRKYDTSYAKSLVIIE